VNVLRPLKVLLVASVLALGSAPVSAADPADTTVVRIATSPIDSAAEPYYAQEMGFFRNAQLNVELQTISNGASIATAVASGAIDVGVGSSIPLALAHERGLPFAILFPAAVYDRASPTTVLMVPKSSSIAGGKDLAGKTIGTQALQTISQLAPEAWIDAHGGDSKNVRFIEMPSAELSAAMTQGRVDAIVAIEPTATTAAADGRTIGDVYGALPQGFAINVWFTTRSWAQAHPQLLAKLITVFQTTARWANAHQRESGVILEKYAKVSPAVVHDMNRCVYGTRLDPKSIQPNIDLALKYGLLSRSFPAGELTYQP
jgi:NitT/TauT family transport system substrate-binding protein